MVVTEFADRVVEAFVKRLGLGGAAPPPIAPPARPPKRAVRAEPLPGETRPPVRPRATAALWSSDSPESPYALVWLRKILESEPLKKPIESSIGDLQLFPLERVLRGIADVRLRDARECPFQSRVANLWDAVSEPGWRFTPGATANVAEVEQLVALELATRVRRTPEELDANSRRAAEHSARHGETPRPSTPEVDPVRARAEKLRAAYEGLEPSVKADVDGRARAIAAEGFAGRGSPLDEPLLALRALRAREDLVEARLGEPAPRSVLERALEGDSCRPPGASRA